MALQEWTVQNTDPTELSSWLGFLEFLFVSCEGLAAVLVDTGAGQPFWEALPLIGSQR